MAKRLAPTKANLFSKQKELRFASEGAELMHQKRDVLVMELMDIVADFSDVESRLRGTLEKVLEDFIPARMEMGMEGIARAISAHRRDLTLEIRRRSVMGIALPEVEVVDGQYLDMPGFAGSTAALDSAISGFEAVIEMLSQYIQTVAAVWRLSSEIEKTQKRINALENIFIPEAQDNIRWIKDVMEENEREELFRLKRLSGGGQQ